MVTFNTRTLGGRISFFQSVSVLGYCVFPLFVMGIIIQLIEMAGFKHVVLKVVLMTIGAIWGSICTLDSTQHHRVLLRITSLLRSEE